MVASLLAPVVAKTFPGPWDSEEGKGVLPPEPQRLLARALGAANVQEVQVWDSACTTRFEVYFQTAIVSAVFPVPLPRRVVPCAYTFSEEHNYRQPLHAATTSCYVVGVARTQQPRSSCQRRSTSSWMKVALIGLRWRCLSCCSSIQRTWA